MAFQFADNRAENVLALLREREGENFEPVKLSVRLISGDRVKAHVPIYKGRDLIKNNRPNDLARMAKKAKGVKGTGIAYVAGIAKSLSALKIKDPCVDALWREVRKTAVKKSKTASKKKRSRKGLIDSREKGGDETDPGALKRH